MSQPPSSGIIRNANVEGTVFYSAATKENELPEKEETFQPPSIKSKKIDALCREAEIAGYRRGLKEGHLQGYEAGKSEGFDFGYQQGVKVVHEELKESVELLNSISGGFQINKLEMFESAKPELIKFSLAICEKLLRNELSDPITFVAVIEKLFQQAKSILIDVPVDIVLAPEDLKLLQSNISTTGYTIEEINKANFVSDASMERGNCRIETSLGLINFDIRRLLQELEIKALEA